MKVRKFGIWQDQNAKLPTPWSYEKMVSNSTIKSLNHQLINPYGCAGFCYPACSPVIFADTVLPGQPHFPAW